MDYLVTADLSMAGASAVSGSCCHLIKQRQRVKGAKLETVCPLLRAFWAGIVRYLQSASLHTIKHNSFIRYSIDQDMKKSNATHTTRKQPGKTIYVFHWDRIFGGVVVLLVLGGFAAYGLNLLFFSSEGTDMAEALAKAKVADTAGSNSVYEKTQLLEEPAFAEDNRAQQLAKSESPETESPTPEVLQSPTANHAVRETAGETNVNAIVPAIVPGTAESATAAQSLEDMRATPAEDELSYPQAGISQDMPLQLQEESSDFADTLLATDTANSPFQLKELKILEPGVKRFLLPRSVSNKEPLGELNDISFNADGIAVVWIYSEVVDKRGSLLNYVWLHEGSQVATVKVDIRGNRWRSYSSKVINQSMSGSWRVELHDGEGRLLASADFLLSMIPSGDP